jgi:hypothetical protein
MNDETNMTITRTIIAGERIFRVVAERRIDIRLMIPVWDYTLVELTGTGISSYGNRTPSMNKDIMWGRVMQRIDAICGIVDVPLDREG